MYSAAQNPLPVLRSYLESEVCRTAHYSDVLRCFKCNVNGRVATMRGLVKRIYARHHSSAIQPSSGGKRRSRSTLIRGSTSEMGCAVDRAICATIAGEKRRALAMADDLIRYWVQTLGHTLQAGQVPVLVPFEQDTLTAADVITADAAGRLWLWEVKTGIPIGFYRKKGTLRNIIDDDGAKIPCTALAMWHLQLQYTRASLERAGVPIYEARVIQIHRKKGEKALVLTVHQQPEWTRQISYLRP